MVEALAGVTLGVKKSKSASKSEVFDIGAEEMDREGTEDPVGRATGELVNTAAT